MLKYQINHRDRIVDKNGNSTLLASTMIVFMQFGSAVATEIINLLLIIEAKDAKDALMNFVALEIISKLDDIYFSTLRSEPLKEAVRGNSPEIIETTKSRRASGIIKKHMFSRVFYKIIKFKYSAYFYFLPMIVPIVAYLSPEIA